MKKKLLLSLLVLGIPLFLFAQEAKTEVKAVPVAPAKKVEFKTSKNTKSPFISKEEAFKIEAAKEAERLAELKRLQEEKERIEKERQEALRKKILCDELKRHPSRIISKSVKLDGIMGSDAIINGKVASKGSELAVKLKDTEKAKVQEIEECGFDINNIKVKVIKVKSSSAVLAYQGERFKVAM